MGSEYGRRACKIVLCVRFYFVQHVGAMFVQYAVVIRAATTRSTCNATMLRDKLKKVLPVLLGLKESVNIFSL